MAGSSVMNADSQNRDVVCELVSDDRFQILKTTFRCLSKLHELVHEWALSKCRENSLYQFNEIELRNQARAINKAIFEEDEKLYSVIIDGYSRWMYNTFYFYQKKRFEQILKSLPEDDFPVDRMEEMISVIEKKPIVPDSITFSSNGGFTDAKGGYFSIMKSVYWVKDKRKVPGEIDDILIRKTQWGKFHIVFNPTYPLRRYPKNTSKNRGGGKLKLILSDKELSILSGMLKVAENISKACIEYNNSEYDRTKKHPRKADLENHIKSRHSKDTDWQIIPLEAAMYLCYKVSLMYYSFFNAINRGEQGSKPDVKYVRNCKKMTIPGSGFSIQNNHLQIGIHQFEYKIAKSYSGKANSITLIKVEGGFVVMVSTVK